MRTRKRLLLLRVMAFFILCFAFAITAPAQEPSFSLHQISGSFPSKGFEREIEFWKKVFTVYGTNEVVFHDARDLRLIFHVETFQKGIEGDAAEAARQRRILKKKIREFQALLEEVRQFGPTSTRLDQRHHRLIKVLQEAGYQITPKLLRRLKADLRFQRGVKDKFRESLIRSGRYLKKIVETFEAYGLPSELAALPHVESSFDYNAYSKAGAAGIWQFTRGTGRYYLKINRYIDERLDPLRATDAAARLFKDNYAVLGDWPLTVTSYNHGRNGILRAQRKYGNDLRKIADHYQSRYFGFASRNFYPEFLAAIEVSRNYVSYFGPLPIDLPLEYESVRLKRAYDSSYLTTVPGLTKEILADFNPQLRRILNSGRRRVIPAGIEVRVPVGHREAVETVLASAKAASGEVMVAADGSTRYRVQLGDALGAIATQFGTTTRQLQRLNGLSNPNRIYPGQTLLVSQGAKGTTSQPTPRPTAAPAPEVAARSAGDATASQSYTVRRGDNLTAIARRFGVEVSDLKRANRIGDPNKIHPGMKLQVPGAGSTGAATHYVVKKGDTLATIAQRFGSSIHEIQNANGIRNPHRIKRGQELLIP